MMRAALRMFVVAAASLILSGCLTYGSIQNRGTTVNEGVGDMQNRGVLLNLVRASHSEPLYFMSINQVQAQSSAQVLLGIPVLTGVQTGLTKGGNNFTSGASKVTTVTYGGSSSNFTSNTNTNFQLGVYSSKDFYNGLLAPLDLDEVNLLLHQGFPRELIFYLVIDRVKVSKPNTDLSCILYNNPAVKPSAISAVHGSSDAAMKALCDPASYASFVLAIRQAMINGLTTEIPISADQGSSGNKPEQITGEQGAPSAGGSSPIQFVLKPPEPETSHAQLCYDRDLVTDEAMTDFREIAANKEQPTFCGHGITKHASGTLAVHILGEDLEVEVTTRSIYGIFNYLGLILDNPQVPPPTLTDYGVPNETTPTGPLLIVDEQTGANCFAAVGYEGRDYCVPRSAETTKRIFNILTALVALKQSPGDLPATQSVLIAP